MVGYPWQWLAVAEPGLIECFDRAADQKVTYRREAIYNHP